ncbi:MAG TPA: Sec-independent protein translocase protein TatB [Phenylobacterium sp.]|uniref:Sec-independent protein translocase protein TatB n=1 Tax=Phenylobacterium sp. TaxID=1871053 RepID=UPI002B48D662|nr:Sec-independent protein translocase protein TatB [Phenylobacterium sp.]HKR90423.1 Sec-independent protein translocase protein TatB [Phenylobacterium sp.]
MFPEGRALEFLLAAAVALVVVGPKDLPILMRKLGQFLGRMRAMAAEFRASFDEMARQSELDELRKEVEAMRKAQIADVAAQAGQADVHEAFTDIHQTLSGIGSEVGAQTAAPYYEAPSEPAPEPKPKPRAKRTTAAKTPKAAAAKAASAKTAKAPAKPRTRKPSEPKA